jgi:hypothetical protein
VAGLLHFGDCGLADCGWWDWSVSGRLEASAGRVVCIRQSAQGIVDIRDGAGRGDGVLVGVGVPVGAAVAVSVGMGVLLGGSVTPLPHAKMTPVVEGQAWMATDIKRLAVS